MPSQPGASPLDRAIADPPSVPDVRAKSDLAGLARRSVRSQDLVAHSVAVIAPSASALSVPFVLMHVVGPGAWLSALLGFGLALLLAAVFSQFATRIAASGSMYTWVTRSLGPFAGLTVGTSMLLGYAILVAFGVSQVIRRSSGAVASASNGSLEPSGSVQWLIGLVAVAACLAISIRGVRLSSRIAYVVEIALVVCLLALVCLALGRDGIPDLSVFSLSGADPTRVLLGATIVMGITVGFESSAALSGEAERPFLNVPRAMVWSVLVGAGLYFLVLLTSTGMSQPGEPGQRGPAARWFADSVDVHVADAILGSLLAVSFFALTLCAWNALARVVFSLAREGLLPAALGCTHRRWGSPVGALILIVPFAIGPMSVAILRGEEVGSLTRTLLQAAVLVLVIAYSLVALALPVFLRLLDEWTLAPVGVALTTAGATVCFAAVDTVEDARAGDFLSLALVAGSLGLAVGWFLWLRIFRPQVLRRMGIHDETIASDLLGG